MTKATPKNGRIPLEFITKMVKQELNQAMHRNKGYILDGFPRSLEEAQAMFEQGEDEEASEETDEDEEIRFPKRPVSIIPELIINLGVDEETASYRLQSLPATERVADHNDESGRALRNF